jgi:hypothetical protein
MTQRVLNRFAERTFGQHHQPFLHGCYLGRRKLGVDLSFFHRIEPGDWIDATPVMREQPDGARGKRVDAAANRGEVDVAHEIVPWRASVDRQH